MSRCYRSNAGSLRRPDVQGVACGVTKHALGYADSTLGRSAAHHCDLTIDACLRIFDQLAFLRACEISVHHVKLPVQPAHNHRSIAGDDWIAPMRWQTDLTDEVVPWARGDQLTQPLRITRSHGQRERRHIVFPIYVSCLRVQGEHECLLVDGRQARPDRKSPASHDHGQRVGALHVAHSWPHAAGLSHDMLPNQITVLHFEGSDHTFVADMSISEVAARVDDTVWAQCGSTVGEAVRCVRGLCFPNGAPVVKPSPHHIPSSLHE
mmetsp:Transcript_46103/g.107841  ORF Transcript_46103/g.107841 Transcript_46103/m.107841 type:complete len:265 (-) Transcript_46103:754-1548(-)